VTGAAVGTARAGGVRRRLLVPFGTRPEVVKLAPVVRALRAAGHRVRAVHTGQHDDPAMAADVPRSLELAPDVQLRLAGGVAARRGALLSGAVDAVAADRPDLVLTLGDTETVPAYALAARAAGVAFGHLEAGLRSFNQRSVEELNRRIATASAQLHFAPTARSAALLAAEGVPAERVFVVGNPVVDALRERGLAPVPPDRRTGVLVTAHRPTNVDDPTRLARLVALVEALSVQVGPGPVPGAPAHRPPAGLVRPGCPTVQAGQRHDVRPAAVRRDARRAGRLPGRGHRFRRDPGGGRVLRRAGGGAAPVRPAVGGGRERVRGARRADLRRGRGPGPARGAGADRAGGAGSGRRPTLPVRGWHHRHPGGRDPVRPRHRRAALPGRADVTDGSRPWSAG
jgi:hypothetical protein